MQSLDVLVQVLRQDVSRERNGKVDVFLRGQVFDLVETVDQEWLTAAADGDVNLKLELERTRQERLAQAKSVDGMIENVLTALQRKPDHSELIEELRTFGYSDEELLSAALTLWLDSRAARERSKQDRASRGYKKPYPPKNGAPKNGAPKGAGKPASKGGKPSSAKKPYPPKGGAKSGSKQGR